MSIRQPFMPKYGSNQVVAPAAASATIGIEPRNKQVRIVNSGASIAYVRTFSSATGAQAATTADFAIVPGMAAVLTKDESHDSLAHISAAGTTLQVMTGEGW